MSDYPVTLLGTLNEFDNFAETGLPPGVRTVTMDSTSSPHAKQGLFVLIQLFLLILLKTPGRDIFSTDSGGGLKRIVGRSVSQKQLSSKRGEISLAISRTEDQMLGSQAGVSSPASERLRSANLFSADFDFGTQTWSITIRIVSDAGSAADVLL